MTPNLVEPAWDGESRFLVSRDLRVRRRNADWFVHLRADAPANIGFATAQEAFMLLVGFGSGAVLPAVSQTEKAVLRVFLDAGLLLSTSYAVQDRTVTVSPDEVLALRAAAPVETLGLLELEAVVLYLLARENSFPDPVCELGSMLGGSTIVLALGCRQSKYGNRVIAVDDHAWHRHLAREPSNESVQALPDTLEPFLENLDRAAVRDAIDVRVADTAESAHEYMGSVSLLFVDADHSLDGVRRDIEAWFPRLRGGGVVAFHDYGNPLWPGVTQAVDEIRADLGSFCVLQTLAIGVKG